MKYENWKMSTKKNREKSARKQKYSTSNYLYDYKNILAKLRANLIMKVDVISFENFTINFSTEMHVRDYFNPLTMCTFQSLFCCSRYSIFLPLRFVLISHFFFFSSSNVSHSSDLHDINLMHLLIFHLKSCTLLMENTVKIWLSKTWLMSWREWA